MSEYAIRVKDITKVYKLYDKGRDRLRDSLGLTRKKLYHEHYALDHVSFDVQRGETVGIIGTNGSGKSTILKIITGLLNPTDGEVEIDGRISALLELGAGFNGEYTGIENVYLNGTMIGFSREEIDAKMQDILDFADIGDFVYQPVKTYSSGMFVRLAFAVAINIEPEILIVDEALSVGDVYFQAKCYRKFEDFKKAGKTIIFVSHDLGSISKYCDRVVLLGKGKKLGEGSPKEMIDIYKKLLVNSISVDELVDAQQAENSLENRPEESTTENGASVKNGDSEEVEPSEGATKAVESNSEVSDAKVIEAVAESGDENIDETDWKSHFEINPYVNEYGDMRAEIIDYAVIDENGVFSTSIIKGTKFQIKSKVKFNVDIEDPIFTYTFKDVHGTSITGTNTLFERVDTGLVKAGEVRTCTFEQQMDLQGGEYLLSISCTGYDGVDFVAFDRKYDLLNITVISNKNTVGFYDMNSKVTVE